MITVTCDACGRGGSVNVETSGTNTLLVSLLSFFSVVGASPANAPLIQCESDACKSRLKADCEEKRLRLKRHQHEQHIAVIDEQIAGLRK